MKRIFLSAAVALSAGCPGDGPPPTRPGPVTAAPPVVDAAVPPPPVAPVPAGPTPVAVDVVAGAPAPWLEPALPDGTPDYQPFDRARIISWGARAALIVERLGPNKYDTVRFGVDLGHGAIGPLPLPAHVVWTGLGGKHDQVFVAVADGTLLAATDLRALAAGTLAPVGAVPGATRWASAPGIIAAAAGDTVSVSTDGGKRFRGAVVLPGKQVVELLVRHDQTLVARVEGAGPDTEPVTLLSRGGARWRKSPYQPWGLTQTGAWIAARSGCPAAVLSADGTHWMNAGAEAGEELRNAPTLGVLLAHDERTFPHSPATPYVTAVKPPPPRYRRAGEVRGQEPCDGAGRGYGRGGGLPVERGYDLLRRVRGSAGPPQRLTATALAMLADGACAATGIDRSNPDRWTCRDGAGFARMPHLLAWNRRDHQPRIIDAPAGCAPVHATADRGLALLRCDGGQQTVVHALTAAATWVVDGRLAASPSILRGIGQADDGTIMVSACASDRHCVAFVRAPRAAGDPAAWREVGGGDVYRALPGGAALVISAEAADGGALRLAVHVDRPDRPRATLASGVPLDALVTSVELDGRTLVVQLDKRGPHTVATDGTLIPLSR